MCISVTVTTLFLGGGKQLLVRAEEDAVISTTGTTSYKNDTIDHDDELVLFFIFIFFALTVSTFGSFLLYVSYLDDRIMKLYVDEGDPVEGEVVATEFTRGVSNHNYHNDNDNDNDKRSDNQKEYFVTIEYSYFLSENYPILIRKQLRVLEGDFLYQGGANRTDGCNNNSIMTPKPTIEIIASRDSFFKSFQYNHGKKLELLVLPNYHLSALPTRQVKRRLSTRYRFFSISFVIAAIFIAVFCYRIAAPLVWLDCCAPSNASFLIYTIFVILALAPIPCIHCWLHSLIQNSLEDEYFEMGGEVIQGGYDDSSISSRSDFGYYPSRQELECSTLGD